MVPVLVVVLVLVLVVPPPEVVVVVVDFSTAAAKATEARVANATLRIVFMFCLIGFYGSTEEPEMQRLISEVERLTEGPCERIRCKPGRSVGCR
jgi:hypothetical protein